MRADKTLSELNDLLESTYNERLSQTARMAVNTIKRLQSEIERLGIENSRLQTKIEIGRESIKSLLEHWENPGEEDDEETMLKSAASFLHGVLKGDF
ncbi:hypothetical protein [Peribacillus frigoritolerans]|uniref:hypothetical protein n=1 Tax=Peribacillus frigoritolerans TaxID=450367 RepID=UPI002EBA54CA|nr:hypothetical protein [Peribacillus frigoritolerans]